MSLREENRPGCTVCEVQLSGEEAFCHICGAKSPTIGRMLVMRYPAIKLNENGKALVCPHCENDELAPGDYCIICGNDIVNRCADSPERSVPSIVVKGCQAILQGNARYCSRCGNESTFYQKGWLPDWRSENVRKAIRNASHGSGAVVELPDIQKKKV